MKEVVYLLGSNPVNSNPMNIMQLLKGSLRSWENPDSNLKAKPAGSILERYLELRVLKQGGSDTLAVYDKFNGFWDNSTSTFSNLVRIIRPGSSDLFIHNLKATIIADLIMDGKIISPYDGSRYILFKNGFLDLKTNRFEKISVADAIVFTKRNRLNVNYIDDPDLPVIRDNGTKWDPQLFINHYTKGDSKRELLFLFTLALGLFGNHHFGVNVNYKGQSGSGKTLLNVIFTALYGKNNVASITASNLSQKFALGNYDSNLAIIWSSENNSNNDYNLIDNYDSLTDPNSHFQKKGLQDIVFDTPPQLYVEGTRFVKEPGNSPLGIYRRTLCYAFPKFDQSYLDGFSVPAIKDYLNRPMVLEWLVYHMIQAYRELVPSRYIDNYSFSAGDSHLTSMFPPEYATWRKEIRNSNSKFDSEINDFIDINVIPYINTNPFEKLTKMHDTILYAMFKDFYNFNHGVGKSKIDDITSKLSPETFIKIFKKLMAKRGFDCVFIRGPHDDGNKHRQTIYSANKMNFKVDDYIHENGDRNNIFDPANPDSTLGRKVYYWFVIVPNVKRGHNMDNNRKKNETKNTSDASIVSKTVNSSREVNASKKSKPHNKKQYSGPYNYTGLNDDLDKWE